MARPPVPPPVSAQARLRQLEIATAALITEVSLQGVLQRVVRVAAEVIGARYAAIAVLGPDGDVVENFTTHGLDPGLASRIGEVPRGHGVLGLIARDGKPVRLADLSKHADAVGLPRHHSDMTSFLGVPILGNQGVVGNLYVTGKTDGGVFTEDDEEIATLLATKTAAAVENARHHEESARLLEEVQQLHRTRERFFAMVNHELRNALAAVYGWSEMLVRKRDPATVPRAAFEVLDSAQQAISLINDLLDLSRLDEDRLKPNIRVVEPLAIAARAVRRVTPAADLKGVTLDVVADAGLPNCETDSNRVEQILINLLSNAIKYAPERSSVRMGIDVRGVRVVFQIEDEGPGVPASEVEQIFDIYVTKAGEESRGLGLGLPLSRRLARLLGGELHAVTRSTSGGCFVLEVPARVS